MSAAGHAMPGQTHLTSHAPELQLFEGRQYLRDAKQNFGFFLWADEYAGGAQNAAEGGGAANAISLVRITLARPQGVAGLNLAIRMEVEQGQSVRRAEATVWRTLSGDYELTAWQWLTP